MTRFSTASDVTDSNAYALSAIEKNATIDGTLAKYTHDTNLRINNLPTTTTNVTFYENGWYRIFRKTSGSGNVTPYVMGSTSEAMLICIKRGFNYNTNECHCILFMNVYCSWLCKSLGDLSNSQIIKNLRVVTTQDPANLYIDIQVVNGNTNGNGCTITLIGSHAGWSAKAELVPDTSTGETIRYTFAIPANG